MEEGRRRGRWSSAWTAGCRRGSEARAAGRSSGSGERRTTVGDPAVSRRRHGGGSARYCEGARRSLGRSQQRTSRGGGRRGGVSGSAPATTADRLRWRDDSARLAGWRRVSRRPRTAYTEEVQRVGNGGRRAVAGSAARERRAAPGSGDARANARTPVRDKGRAARGGGGATVVPAAAAPDGAVARLRRRHGERRDGVVGPIGGVTSTNFDDTMEGQVSRTRVSDWSGCRLATGAMTSSHSIRNEMCFIRGAVDIPHSRHFRYGDAVSDDRVCLALPRLCDPDPVAPAFVPPNMAFEATKAFPFDGAPTSSRHFNATPIMMNLFGSTSTHDDGMRDIDDIQREDAQNPADMGHSNVPLALNPSSHRLHSIVSSSRRLVVFTASSHRLHRTLTRVLTLLLVNSL
ncbi:hypothetical protein Scep_027837 [Stephania cephalantha]|uniref:Uncharacterized protein n=1 Tax=Stephania cephalantha TaxID=152367 RepID=A0AAP0HMX1_9MAGN